MADDQRYCLQCGERRTAMSSVLAGGPPVASTARQSPPATPPGSVPPSAAGAGAGASRNGTLTVIAGVGVLLLAMGVGVLIGRSGSSKSSSPPVISVAPSTSAGSAGTGAAEAAFTDDWPAGTSGFTIELKTLPQSGTAPATVVAAKAEATAKGASSVGALKSEDFSSLTAGSYIIYSGVYHSRAEAEKALPALKKKFPTATVIHVSNSASQSSSSGSGTTKGAGTPSNPAPPTVVQSERSGKVGGKSFEEKSKNLPDVVSTG
jgi:hypothetical protein